MSTRSATNKRTSEREYTGATRKGATSAKLARPAASSVRVEPASARERRRKAERGESLVGLSKEEKRARKREERAREDRAYSASNIMLKEDPEYHKRRRVFWIVLGAVIVLTVLVWAMLTGIVPVPEQFSGMAEVVFVILAYACIFVAFIYDFVRVRPLRNYYRAKVDGMSDTKIIEFLALSGELDAKDAAKGGKSGGHKVEPATEEPERKRGPKKNHRSRR